MELSPNRLARGSVDPRYFQIGALGAALVYGQWALGFELNPLLCAGVILFALVAQYAGTRWAELPAFDPRSALISSFSLCLLLRTDAWPLALLAAAVAVGSKFFLRFRGKHVFNPTNFAIVLLLALTDRVWVSPGQWGASAIFAFFVLCAGGLVIFRSLRADVSLAFLGFYAALVIGRSLWLGDPLAVPLHRLMNGSLLIFAFFMISDPKTTPDSRPGRALYALLVALLAMYIEYRLFRTNGALWSLALLSPLVPLIDRLAPGTRYEWNMAASLRNAARKGA